MFWRIQKPPCSSCDYLIELHKDSLTASFGFLLDTFLSTSAVLSKVSGFFVISRNLEKTVVDHFIDAYCLSANQLPWELYRVQHPHIVLALWLKLSCLFLILYSGSGEFIFLRKWGQTKQNKNMLQPFWLVFIKLLESNKQHHYFQDVAFKH